MVFRPEGANVFKLRVTDNAGHSGIFSTGTSDRDVAEDVERMVKGFHAQRKWAYLTAIATKKVKLPVVYDAFVSGTLDAFMAGVLDRAADVDLDPLVAEWSKRANAKYVKQVRRFIPAGARFPASGFRRKALSEFLAALECSGPTKNRYRAALSVFAKWLVEREVIEANPLRDVAMYKEHEPRMMWLNWHQARVLAAAAPSGYRDLFGIMAATGIELGAALRLTRNDVDRDARTIHAQGSKTPWRNRVVRFEEWADGFVSGACSQRVGPTPLFPQIGYADALKEFKRAQKAVPVGGHRLHDLRHTYAVNALKKGYSAQVVAHQLGHKDSSMVTRVYGRFIPDASDYNVEPATVPATAPRKKVKR